MYLEKYNKSLILVVHYANTMKITVRTWSLSPIQIAIDVIISGRITTLINDAEKIGIPLFLKILNRIEAPIASNASGSDSIARYDNELFMTIGILICSKISAVLVYIN